MVSIIKIKIINRLINLFISVLKIFVKKNY
uniref:Uncharacterized protein n=1 Tax=viral metagenome TaxID=1070528 RepID=A0A6C0BDD0_9ZZZZ